MYAVCARLQRAPLVEVPLRDGDEDFSIDLAAVAELAQRKSARLVFLCSPGNPAGGSVSAGAVLDFARRLRGQGIGRASCRERVCVYVCMYVVAGSLTKKYKK